MSAEVECPVIGEPHWMVVNAGSMESPVRREGEIEEGREGVRSHRHENLSQPVYIKTDNTIRVLATFPL